MIEKIFIILGYGIPEDIFQDAEYRSYLNLAFNDIFEYSREHEDASVRIIFCGGKTDMIPPYKRSEAGEMKRYFDFLRKRKFVAAHTKRWTLLADTASLSTMENLLNAKKIIASKHIEGASLGIFCEHTRKGRIRKLADKIFGKDAKIEIVPVDFSISENRYLPEKYILEKEKNALKFDFWALKSEENYKLYHKNFSDKFEFLRSYGPDRHEEAIRAWWENERDLALREGFWENSKDAIKRQSL
jgi:hypothetical protein